MQLASSQTLPSPMGYPHRLLTPLPASQTGKPDMEGCIQGRSGCAIPESHVPIQGAKGPKTPSQLGTRIPGFLDAEHAFSPFRHLFNASGRGGCFSSLAFYVHIQRSLDIKGNILPVFSASLSVWSGLVVK